MSFVKVVNRCQWYNCSIVELVGLLSGKAGNEYTSLLISNLIKDWSFCFLMKFRRASCRHLVTWSSQWTLHLSINAGFKSRVIKLFEDAWAWCSMHKTARFWKLWCEWFPSMWWIWTLPFPQMQHTAWLRNKISFATFCGIGSLFAIVLFFISTRSFFVHQTCALSSLRWPPNTRFTRSRILPVYLLLQC